MKAFLVALAVLAPLSALAAPTERLLMSCEPTQILEWPSNGKIEISTTSQGLKLVVRSNYYGYIMEDQYMVRKTSQQSAGELVDIYESQGLQLTVSTYASPRGFDAHLNSKNHGRVKMICRSSY